MNVDKYTEEGQKAILAGEADRREKPYPGTSWRYSGKGL